MTFTKTNTFSSGVNTSFSSQLNTNFDEVANEFNGITRNSLVMAPVGAVVAWLKDLSGTPSALPGGWVECNGQTIIDGDSPYDGVTIPNINGNNNFLRGNNTSGTESNEAHTHTGFATNGSLNPVTVQAGGSHYRLRAGSYDVDRYSSTVSAGSTNVIQSTTIVEYYTVVWIMRIK